VDNNSVRESKEKPGFLIISLLCTAYAL